MSGACNAKKASWDPRERLAEIQPETLDGVTCWPLREVCRAFRIADQRTASRLIPAACKRYKIECPRPLDKRRYCCITADGVRVLALRYGRVPLHQIMSVLQEQSKARHS